MSAVRSLAKSVIPHAIRRKLKVYMRGKGLECPCCGGRFYRFLPEGMPVRENAKCPNCKSLERHRLVWMFLRDEIRLGSTPTRLLHFAPERSIKAQMDRLPNLETVTADIVPGKADVQADITNLPFEDNEFDAIMCSHVLEHVRDDRKAMRELFRVLKPGGWALLIVPMLPMDKTFEPEEVTDPADRQVVFGDADHVRIYGRDYKDRLEECGFAVEIRKYLAQFSEADIQRFSLAGVHDFYIATKPAG